MTRSSRDNVVALPPTAPEGAVQGTLALALQARREPPRPAASHPDGAKILSIDRADGYVNEWARRFVQAAAEVVGGDRPAVQVIRWASAEVYADLNRRALLVARAGRHQPGYSRVQAVRPQVARVHPCHINSDVVETSVRVRYGRRSRAVAARFERQEDRWVCTALEFA
ncbi:hypothetical protein JCM18899A_16680 [Nocardioides sp. AN3]